MQCLHPGALHGAVACHNTHVLSRDGTRMAFLMSPQTAASAEEILATG